jgi:hypothetical protein
MQPDVTAFDSFGSPQDRDIAELARLADALVEQIAETRNHYAEMRAQLEDHGVPAAAEADAEAEAEVEAETEAEFEAEPSRHSAREEARMATLNLAISGVDREEAVTQLHRSFDLDDPSDVVDEVYGSRLAQERPPKRRFLRRRRRS